MYSIEAILTLQSNFNPLLGCSIREWIKNLVNIADGNKEIKQIRLWCYLNVASTVEHCDYLMQVLVHIVTLRCHKHELSCPELK